MRKRRFAHVYSDDEEEEEKKSKTEKRGNKRNTSSDNIKKSKKNRDDEDEDYVEEEEEEDEELEEEEEPVEEEEEEEEEERSKKKKKSPEKVKEPEKADEEDEEEEEEAEPEEEPVAIPIGDPVRVSGKGKRRKKHYSSFEYEGNIYELEDPVLLTPETEEEKPYVAIIKDISDAGGGLMVTGQWFYRPEEAAKKGGGTWQSQDNRELFYSFHLDDVPAESVMHRCVVHFIPLNKKIPLRSQHPGFIVQRVYDTVERKLWKLTDKDYEDGKQDEINLLVKKTMKRLGELPDIEPEDVHADHHDQVAAKWNLRRKNMVPLDTSRAAGPSTKSDNLVKADTPGSCTSDSSEYYAILAKFKVLTSYSYRDKWLEKLLQGIQQACNSKEDASTDNREKESATSLVNDTNGNNSAVTTIEAKEKSSDGGEKLSWPDSAVSAITALEKASHETLGSDFQKYNQKMRQLDFNLKNNALLARRLLNKELDPAVILTMSPNELKDGLTADEKTTEEPDRTERMQMTDARCSRCTEKKVAVADIIHAGGHGDRYQLECLACGHSWYASGDAISSLTIDTRSVAGNVGTAPWATAKFEDVEKALVSPREHLEKPAADVFLKSTAPYVPVLESQKSFNRSKPEDPSTIG